MSDLNDQYLRALDICRELNGEKAELEERIQQLEKWRQNDCRIIDAQRQRIQQLELGRWESGLVQPPLCRPYLVHTSGVTVVMDWDGECWRGIEDGYIYAVTHWMPLPPPPKENDNG